MAEAAEISHNDPPEKEESPEKYTNEDKNQFIQKVIDKCRVAIVRDLDRHAELFDVFREEEAFGENTQVEIKDLEGILKNRKTSDCNRAICDVFRSNPNNYIKLKSALVKTEHKELLATIEKTEAEYHDELKGTPQGCVCTDKTRCPLLERLMCQTKLPAENSVKSDQIKALQQDLIKVYKPYCEWENPVTGDDEEIISRMYVSPDVKLIRERSDNKTLLEVQQKKGQNESKTLSYRQVFYTKTEPCSNIYVTGDAGMGKTTFCKQLLHTWCKAVEGNTENEVSDEDVSVLKEFTFLFYVSLRETECQYHIDDMIKANVLHDVTTDLKVSDILKTEKCLIVLDGLDEWSPPRDASICPRLNKELPGRNTMNEKCVYLTSTRNWKFEIIDLKSRDVDKHVELCGIGKNSSHTFAKKMVDHLNSKSQNKRHVSDFFIEVQFLKKNINSITNVPVVLTQLITLWYYSMNIVKSQVDLYCKMLNLLLQQASTRLPEITSTVSKPVQTNASLPECFNEEASCLNHTQLIFCLSKLAFVSLLNEKKEDSLVFKRARLDVYGIDALDIKLCLKCGILTQNKVFGNFTGQFKKYAFLHKQLQEFLAAVYLVTSSTVEDNMRQVEQYCDKIETMLETGQLLRFVCGMNADIGNELLVHLSSRVSKYNHVRNSRHSVRDEISIRAMCMYAAGIEQEGASNDITVNMHLQDYWIDSDTIHTYVNRVAQQNKNDIKSVYILTHKCNEDDVNMVLNHLKSVHTLEKLYIACRCGEMSDRNYSILAQVINDNVGTLKSLCLREVDLRHEGLFSAVLRCIPSLLGLRLGVQKLELETEIRSELEGEDLDEILNMERFELELGLRWIKYCPAVLNHDQIIQLLSAHPTHMAHLRIGLHCTDHQGECRPELDLSAYTQLQTLELRYDMCVTNLQAVVNNIESVDLWMITVAHSTMKKFIEALAQTSHKVDVMLMQVTVTEDMDTAAEDLALNLQSFDNFVVARIDIAPDKTWVWVEFETITLTDAPVLLYAVRPMCRLI